MFRVNSIVFSRTRLGPAYCIAPLVPIQTNITNAMAILQGGLKNETLREQMQKKLREVADSKDG
jgi:hypothetical protein